MNWSAGLRPGSMSRVLKHAGSETGAPIATVQGFNARILCGFLILIVILILAFF
jgi:hypothetical protein